MCEWGLPKPSWHEEGPGIQPVQEMQGSWGNGDYNKEEAEQGQTGQVRAGKGSVFSEAEAIATQWPNNKMWFKSGLPGNVPQTQSRNGRNSNHQVHAAPANVIDADRRQSLTLEGGRRQRIM